MKINIISKRYYFLQYNYRNEWMNELTDGCMA